MAFLGDMAPGCPDRRVDWTTGCGNTGIWVDGRGCDHQRDSYRHGDWNPADLDRGLARDSRLILTRRFWETGAPLSLGYNDPVGRTLSISLILDIETGLPLAALRINSLSLLIFSAGAVGLSVSDICISALSFKNTKTASIGGTLPRGSSLLKYF